MSHHYIHTNDCSLDNNALPTKYTEQNPVTIMSAAPATNGSVAASHGRGGAGNIHPDDTQYVDGSVTRSGPEGSHGDGAYSVGRGGE